MQTLKFDEAKVFEMSGKSFNFLDITSSIQDSYTEINRESFSIKSFFSHLPNSSALKVSSSISPKYLLAFGSIGFKACVGTYSVHILVLVLLHSADTPCPKHKGLEEEYKNSYIFVS